MSNPETHTCPTCGYIWLHGRDGSHNCDVLLLDRIENLQLELNRAQSRIKELDSELQGARRVISQIPDTL